MKRSNRLVLLVGVFLAIIAFVGILLLASGSGGIGGGGGPRASAAPTTGPVVVAAADIPLSTRITADQVTTITIDLKSISTGAFTNPSQVIGQIVRQQVSKGAQITSATLNGGSSPGQITNLECPATLRCMAVQVDQVSGVGTVIKTGDYVDAVVGLTGDKFPVITISPTDKSVTVVAGINSTSVKLLLQGLQVVGTLLPPVAPPPANSAATPAPSGSGAPSGPSTALNGQQEIVILAVSAQQSEVLKFVQMDGNVTLALRSPNDFIDPTTGAPIPPTEAKTTGIILKTLIDSYGVLPPQVIQTVLPSAKP